ncbi:MAG TPA: MoxR family ATPase [Acidimicrobiales bacterium]|nr:MoxR family ATPase [Acidimicrobiales bacterium]
MVDDGAGDDGARSGAGRPGPAPGRLPAGIAGPPDMADALDRQDYLADEEMATACYLALALRRPLFLEGTAGVGKTAVAEALAGVLDAPLIRLQCFEGIDAAQALYDWDFPRQLLHLRASEAVGRTGSADSVEHELYDRRFLLARPLLRSLETTPSVLLIDEVDRADDEFEALLLEVLSDFTISIPELGTVVAEVPPVVVVTSNRTREVHDALKRRCLYLWVENPSYEREVAIIRRRLPDVTVRIAEKVAAATRALRSGDLLKAPGVAEAIDWAEALMALGAADLTPELASATLGSVLKYREDVARVRALGLPHLVERVPGGG